MFKKRGDSRATNIATLIFLIGLFIIFYVLLIPAETRNELLGQGFTKSNVPLPGHAVTASGKVLLTASPGNVYALERGQHAIPLTTARLYVRSEDETIDIADRVSLTKGLFSDEPQTLYFKIADPSSVKDLQLFFFVPESVPLYIEINGNRIFDGQIDSTGLPIKLPNKLIRKDNTLKLGLTGTYFLTKSVQLTSLSVKESFTSENRAAKRSFVLSASERAGLKAARLDYFINCFTIDPSNQGEFTLTLNGRVLFSDMIACDAGPQALTLDLNDIKSGTNYVDFEISKGDYSFESMAVLLDISEKYYPEYNFDMITEDYDSAKGACNSNDYDGCSSQCNSDCRDTCSGYSNYNGCYDNCFGDCENECFGLFCSGSKKLILELDFPNNRDRKIASITVNRDVINIDTTSDVFFQDISPSANRGANYIKIVPKNDFEVKTLVVSLEPKT